MFIEHCKFPGCVYRGKAVHFFSLVPLCQMHYETIVDETNEFYRFTGGGKGTATLKRPNFSKIKDLKNDAWKDAKHDILRNRPIDENGLCGAGHKRKRTRSGRNKNKDKG